MKKRQKRIAQGDDLERWSKEDLIAELRRERKYNRSPEPNPAAPRPDWKFGTALAGFLFPDNQRRAAAEAERPLWYCRFCQIEIGLWNPNLPQIALFCPQCRRPLAIHGRRQMRDGSITITAEPILEAPTKKSPLLIEGPSPKDR